MQVKVRYIYKYFLLNLNCMNKKANPHKKLIDRLSRAEGQIRSLKKTLQESPSPDCKQFITQIKAARSALKAVSESYIATHIHTCQRLPAKERDKQIGQAIKLLNTD